MELTREVSIDIVSNSSTFDERLANGYFIPRSEPDQNAISHRLERWCEIAAKGDREKFKRLLALKGLDLESVKAGLSPVTLSDQADLPDWTDLLRDGLKAAGSPTPEPSRFLLPNEVWPFEQIVAAFVETARGRLRAIAGSAYNALADGAHASLERKLLFWLVNVCGSALILEFSIFRMNRQPALAGRVSELVADDSSEIYLSYVAHMLSGGLIAFLREYSVLARAIATLMKNWIDSAAEFLDRLTSDRDRLAEAFHAGQDCGLVEELSAGLSDPHRGGRSVFVLTFSSGLKLVYKPKSLETEDAYTRLVEWINRRGLSLKLKGLKVLSRRDYGWVEFIEHKPTSSEAERARFYRRGGMLLCLFYLLESTDVHLENLIAAGEYPVLIDAETLITPSLDDEQPRESDTWAETIAVRRLKTSVLHVGMLPAWRSQAGKQFHDMSALGGVGGEDITANTWQGVATDNLRRQLVTGKMGRNENVPFSAEEVADPARYAEEIVAGFREMYNLVLTERDALLDPDGPLDELARAPMRLVFRDTSTYFSILKNSMDATLLRDGAERSIHLELLSRVLLVSDSNARFAPFLKAEKQALADLDIPFFTVHPKSRSVNTDCGKTIENHFPQAGYERVRNNLLGLGRQNLEEQIGIIRGSFWAKAATQRSHMPAIEEPGIAAISVPEPGDLLQEAVNIARQLERQAVRGGDGSITWVGLTSHNNGHNYQFGQLGPGLFDGLAGIALFMAALERAGGEEGWKQLAMGTLKPIQRSVSAYETILRARRTSRLESVTLGLTGVGSIVYALTRVGQLLREEGPIEIARAAASLLNSESFGAGESLDVSNGAAGAILGLLSLYEIRLEPSLLDTAISFGDSILKSNEAAVNGNRPASLAGGAALGFVRGPAGVAHALLCLYRATNEKRFLYTAQELMPVAGCQEWDSMDANWSTGSTGLGLTWLYNLAAIQSKQAARNIDAALERCLDASLNTPDQIFDGIAGRLDFLVEASQHVGYEYRLLDAARKQAGWCINRAKRDSGFRLHSHLPPGAFLPGFYEGLAGLGYEFLRLAFPKTLPSVLLWN